MTANTDNDATKLDEPVLSADCPADGAHERLLNTPRDMAITELAVADSPKVAGKLRMPSPGINRYSNKQRRKQPRRIATPRARSRPAQSHRRRSRFGLVWAAAFLCLGVLWAFRAPSRPDRQSAPSIASVLPATETSAPRAAARMKYIEDYRLGERIIVTNPLGGEPDAEPDPATWRTVALRMRKPSGKWMKIKLIQPPEWLAEVQPRTGLMIELYLPEMGIAGAAEVLGVGPCPKIEPGEGSVVTGLFEHESDGNLVNLWLEGCREPIGVTDNHPFFSKDRCEFIAAGELRPREVLLTLTEIGTVRVVEVTRRPRDEMVYNLRVNGQHVYHVGPLGVLVHNECAWARLQKWANAEGGYRNPFTNEFIPYAGTLEADHILPKQIITSHPDWRYLTPEQQSFLLNYPGNIQPLPKSLNASKKDLMARRWAETPLAQDGGGFDKAYVEWLQETQEGMKAYFDELTKLFKKQNGY